MLAFLFSTIFIHSYISLTLNDFQLLSTRDIWDDFKGSQVLQVTNYMPKLDKTYSKIEFSCQNLTKF